jgi:hypothetical protein
MPHYRQCDEQRSRRGWAIDVVSRLQTQDQILRVTGYAKDVAWG